MMWRFAIALVAVAAFVGGQQVSPRSGDELVSSVAEECADMTCVKLHVLSYLDNVLDVQSETARSAKNIDNAIFKRVARVLKTHEFRYKLPELLFDDAEVVYNPRTGVDVDIKENEARGMLKKKILFPLLLLLKLKLKALLPIFVAIIGLKSLKALILSKLAIVIVLGFVIYQLVTKSGMPMPMSMAPVEPPPSMYGPPMSTPSSYEPGWEPNQGGPYSRVWTSNNNDAQNIAYSAYYPGESSSSTSRP